MFLYYITRNIMELMSTFIFGVSKSALLVTEITNWF